MENIYMWTQSIEVLNPYEAIFGYENDSDKYDEFLKDLRMEQQEQM